MTYLKLSDLGYLPQQRYFDLQNFAKLSKTTVIPFDKILLIFKFSTESYFKRIWKILKSCNSSTSHLKSIKTAKEIISKYDTLLQKIQLPRYDISLEMPPVLTKLSLGQMAIFAKKSRRIYTEMTPHQSWLTNTIHPSMRRAFNFTSGRIFVVFKLFAKCPHIHIYDLVKWHKLL